MAAGMLPLGEPPQPGLLPSPAPSQQGLSTAALGSLPLISLPGPAPAAAQSLTSSARVFVPFLLLGLLALPPSHRGGVTYSSVFVHSLGDARLRGRGLQALRTHLQRPSPACSPLRLRAVSSADTLQCRARSGLLVRFHLQLFSCHYFKDELWNT